MVGGVWLPSADRHLEENMTVGKKSSWRNGKLTYQTHKLDAAMRYQPEERRRTCIDIGAHVGLWSMWLAELFEQVHAFEPLAGFHEELFRRNVPNEHVEFHPFALGDRAERMRMNIPRHRSCNSYILHGTDPQSSAECERQQRIAPPSGGQTAFDSAIVEVRTLDSFDLQNVDFIKIDTEGFELCVLRGARETIEKWRPNIIIEQAGMDRCYGHEAKAALKMLEKLGMTCKGIMGPDHIMVWE
jgi:FkbM family methyltransferase